MRDKGFEIASDLKYDGYQKGLVSMIYKFFDEKVYWKSCCYSPNYQLPNELHKQIIRKFKRRNIYSSFRDIIWGVDLADMQSLSNCNKGIKFSCVQPICLVNMHWLFL